MRSSGLLTALLLAGGAMAVSSQVATLDREARPSAPPSGEARPMPITPGPAPTATPTPLPSPDTMDQMDAELPDGDAPGNSAETPPA